MADETPITPEPTDPYWKTTRERDEELRVEERRRDQNRKNLEKAVRDAVPGIAAHLQAIADREEARRRASLRHPKRTDALIGEVHRYPPQPEFPERVAEAEEFTEESSAPPKISFVLSNASVTVDDVVIQKVKVFDGKVNGVFPSGMGFDNYVLTPSDPNDAIIYVGITFNPTTLALTSIFLDVKPAALFPVSQLTTTATGFLYFQIGFTYMVGDSFQIVNTLVGDINFAFTYGSYNSLPALLPVKIDNGSPGWLNASVFI